MTKSPSKDERWGLAGVRANIRKTRPRAKTFYKVRDRVERNLEINADELSEAIEGLASLAGEGELPVGISRDDIDQVQTNIMLAENELDDSDAITRHMNSMAPISARWGMIGVRVERALSEVEFEHNRWVAEAKINVAEVLYQKSRNEGATANNSRPNKIDVENYFIVLYGSDPNYISRKNLRDDLKHVRDYVEIIQQQIKIACDMVTNIGHMIRQMVDQGAIVIKKRSK